MTNPHSPPVSTATPPTDENQLITERREKLTLLRQKALEAGAAVFPNDFKPAHRAGPLHAAHGKQPNEVLEPMAVPVSVAGRMMLKRVMGKACFATLQDGSGVGAEGRIQIGRAHV